MSAQYFLTPLLESCQSWYSRCPEGVDDTYWFSGHLVKDQGQTAGLHLKCWLLNNLWPFARWFIKLATLVDYREKIILLAFKVTRSRSNYWSHFSIVHSIFLNWPDLVQRSGHYRVNVHSFWILHQRGDLCLSNMKLEVIINCCSSFLFYPSLLKIFLFFLFMGWLFL